jgi:hypothetical protein
MARAACGELKCTPNCLKSLASVMVRGFFVSDLELSNGVGITSPSPHRKGRLEIPTNPGGQHPPYRGLFCDRCLYDPAEDQDR